MKLSKKRAKSVYSELIDKGIPEERLRYQGFSNSLLLVNPERSEEDRRKNRRVDVILSKNKNPNTPPVIVTQEEFDKAIIQIKKEAPAPKTEVKKEEKTESKTIFRKVNLRIGKKKLFKNKE